MTYILITLLLISIGINVALYIGSSRALSKIEYYENFIYSRRDAYKLLLANIRLLDSKQIFEKDDEVGVTFTAIKNEVEEFEKIIEE
jgi:hypothetical protein